MPKTISPAMLAHIRLPVTTLAECWKVVRIDNQVFTYTSHDRDLVVSGLTYASTSGFVRSAIANHSDGQVDNLEVTGFFTATGLRRHDIEAGRFDYASVYLFLVNWADLTMAQIDLRRGFFGECILSPTGMFQTELRGINQALIQEFNNTLSPLCRADLGDNLCKVPIKPKAWLHGHTYAPGAFVTPATLSSDAALVATFENDGGGGVSGGSEPAWNFTVGGTTADGGMTWTAITPLRQVATVAVLNDQNSFQPSTMFHPGTNLSNNGSVAFINNITSGCSLVVSDGINTASYTAPFDMTAGAFLGNFMTNFNAHSSPGPMQMTATVSGLNITFLNHSGKQAYIQKSRDGVPGIRIAQFQPAYLDNGTIEWVTGDSAGLAIELKTYDFNNNLVRLWLPTGYPIQVGDKFIYYAGCDKTRRTCKLKFDNILNMRAEPDTPGINKMMSYPQAQ